jgi:hypothetical protein
MKDYYDIWLLSQQFDFAGAGLMRAARLPSGGAELYCQMNYQSVCQSSSFPTPANYRSGTRSFAGVD